MIGEHVPRKESRARGLYPKFDVQRLDGKGRAGQAHYRCEYLVLDLTHDKHAIAAILAYATACEYENPLLALDLRAKAARLTELHA